MMPLSKDSMTMHENEISRLVIGAAIEVHREIGPGILESLYEEALCHELTLRGLPFIRQPAVPFVYKGVKLAADLKADLVVGEKVVVELKAKEQVTMIDRLKVRTYLRLLNVRLGLIVNFHTAILKDGIFRIANELTPPEELQDPPDLHA